MTTLSPLAERTVPGLHATLAARVQRLVSRDAPILDIGCGTGAWLSRLAGLGFTGLQGTDLDTEQFGLSGIPVHRNDLDSATWSVDAGRFELATAIEVIEHLQNPGNFLRNARQCLAPRGYLVLTTPNVHSLHARLRFLLTGDMKQFGRIGDPTHLTPVLDSMLQRLAVRQGFEIQERWGYPQSGDAVGARAWVNLTCRVLRHLLPEPLAGDVYCALLRRVD